MVKAPRRRVGSRSLGQNFLVDRNILDVIERLASLSADDVVLEVGGGLGVLSERLAAGEYRLRFASGNYFAAQGVTGFYPEVVVVFTIADAAQHYHVPVLLNPFGYSTYRGT